ncbi:unnamed protein product, partial [Ectocarpus sp. 12 AP-2014]
AARQCQTGSDKAKGILVNDKFAALVIGLSKGWWLSGYPRLGKSVRSLFWRHSVTFLQRLHHYVSKFRSAFSREYGTALKENIVNAVDRDLSLLVAPAAGRASDKLRTRLPHSPPVGDFAQ